IRSCRARWPGPRACRGGSSTEYERGPAPVSWEPCSSRLLPWNDPGRREPAPAMERPAAGYDLSDSASTVRRGRGKITRLGSVEMKETADPQATGEARRILAKGLPPAKTACRSIRRASPPLGRACRQRNDSSCRPPAFLSFGREYDDHEDC